MPVPTLTTERLVLRGHRASDLDACLAMWSDLEVVRHISGRPSTREEVWARILRYVGHWELMGYGMWAVEAEGRFVGECGLAQFERGVPEIDAPEAGWVFAPEAHGKGYATEAMRAVLAWTTAPRTVCMIAPDNAASLRVADKLGYRETALTAYKGEPAIVLTWPAPL